jgi:pimeloyl-ACP methyl ester carboxylesterase
MRDRRVHRERWLNALTQSPVPLALINGGADPVSGEHLVTRYQELGCRLDWLTKLPEIGHYPQVEAPEQVTAAYLEFFKTVK